MRFARPEYLYALSLLPVLLLFYAAAFRKKARALARFGNQALLSKMTRTTSFRRQRVKAGLALLAFLFFILALARPQMGTRTETVKRKGLEIVVALDLSNSMLAEDVKPNRLERAKHAVRTLLEKFRGDQVGLVVFAGAAFLQCPLTSDYSAVALFLDGVDTETISMQGTAIGDALHTALAAFNRKAAGKHSVVILLTDGEDHEGEPLKAAKEAADQGVRIYPIGIGGMSGEPIPVIASDGTTSGYKRDTSGAIVMSRLDETTLEKIADLTHGRYYRSTLSEDELNGIYEDISTLEKEEFESKEFTQYEERYQALLLCGLLLIGLEALLTDRLREKQAWFGRFE